MNVIVLAAVVLAVFVLIFTLGSLFFAKDAEREKHIRRRLDSLNRAQGDKDALNILRNRDMSETPWIDDILRKISFAGSLQNMLRQGRINIHVSVFILVMAVFGMGGFLFMRAAGQPFVVACSGGALGLLPLFWARRRKRVRMAKFQRQLPDALELIARALKAGHAFPSGLRMVADEFGDPIGPEFSEVLEEINFGVDTDVALHALTHRVDCPDLKFFTVSVNIQRETGGNLSEIVENIARLVRDRFKLHGKVRVLSAEGKFSAWILLALPFVVALAIYFLNPEYLTQLFTDPLGNMMLTVAAIMMGFGMILIKRLVIIKV